MKEINNRLNDLLNQKDQEIEQMTIKLMSLEEDNRSLRSKSPTKSMRASPKQTSSSVVKGYGAVTTLENKLLEMERENKELQKEIRVLQRIQERQGNALENHE